MVLVDANVVLELVLPGRKRVDQVKECLLKYDLGLTTLSVHLLFHFGRLASLDDELMHTLISAYHIIDLCEIDYTWARDNEIGKDFEDALQVAAAIRSGCTQFITLDRQLAKNYAKLITCIVP